METRTRATHSERILPHPSVSVLRRRSWSSTSTGLLAGAALVAIPLLLAVIAPNTRSRSEAAFPDLEQSGVGGHWIAPAGLTQVHARARDSLPGQGRVGDSADD